MIFYPLNVLIKAGIKEILIIVAPEHSGQFINLLGSIREITVIYFELKIVLKEVFGVHLNLQKSSPLALQLHSVVDPVSFMEPIYHQCPDLRLIPFSVQGTVILGVPIGTNEFVNDEIGKNLLIMISNVKSLFVFHLRIAFFFLLVIAPIRN
jgi:hypothetical protein